MRFNSPRFTMVYSVVPFDHIGVKAVLKSFLTALRRHFAFDGSLSSFSAAHLRTNKDRLPPTCAEAPPRRTLTVRERCLGGESSLPVTHAALSPLTIDTLSDGLIAANYSMHWLIVAALDLIVSRGGRCLVTTLKNYLYLYWWCYFLSKCINHYTSSSLHAHS